MYVLQGNETTEQQMLWIKNYNDKIDNIVLLMPAARLTFFRRHLSPTQMQMMLL